MKRILFLPAIIAASPAAACVTCNKKIQEAIFDSTFYPNLIVMLSAFFVLAAIIIVLSWMSARRHRRRLAAGTGPGLSAVPLTTAAAVLGIGLGGFIDGIALHQILQWHQMLSNRIPPDTVIAKSVNMFWDGIFHAFTLLTTVIGVVLLWRLLHRSDVNRSGYLLAGGLLGGWALFNIVEGLIDHQILGLHNVREQSASVEAWNWGFIGFSLVLLLLSLALIRRGGRHGAQETRPA